MNNFHSRVLEEVKQVSIASRRERTCTPREVAPSPGRPMRFPRSIRLLKHVDFDRVYQQGRRQFLPHMTVFYLRRDSGLGLRVGFTVSRALGAAVDRNRMKRRLREAVRLRRQALSVAADVVINPKRSLLTIEFETVLTEISRAFRSIQEKLAANE